MLALDRHPELPTGLVDTADRFAGGESWKSLHEYTAGLPKVVHEVGRVLAVGLLDTVAAVEFPVYWCGLAAGNRFVHSRIDVLTRNEDGSCDIWELKTKWGRSRVHEHRPPFRDIRQAVLYCYMFSMQTGTRVSKFHLRYARVSPSGDSITVVTHTYRFSGLRGFLDDALGRTEAYDQTRVEQHVGLHA